VRGSGIRCITAVGRHAVAGAVAGDVAGDVAGSASALRGHWERRFVCVCVWRPQGREWRVTRADIDGACRYERIGVIGVSAESMLLMHVWLGERKWRERRQMRQYLYFCTSNCASICTLVLAKPPYLEVGVPATFVTGGGLGCVVAQSAGCSVSICAFVPVKQVN